MSNTEMIRELRALTSAGMKDCKDALEETGWDLQKAVDAIKVKGLNIADGRTGRVASEGVVGIYNIDSATPVQIMVEINCQTDFVANSDEFKKFVQSTLEQIGESVRQKTSFDVNSVEEARQALVSTTKENIVVRRWWIEESLDASRVLVFPYLHSNSKIGVLLTLQAPSFEASINPAFRELGADLAMQICAMSPIAISPDRIPQDEKDRQKAIFETQLRKEMKPEKMWEKIIEGKFRKWNTDVCLLEQESVVLPKTPVKQVLKNVGATLGGEVTVVNFVRCQVGEGIEVKKDNLAEEVSKLTNIQQPHTGHDPLANIYYPDVKK